jgi:hypothetical protein
VNRVIIDDSNDEDNGEINQLNREVEELKNDNIIRDGVYTTLTIKKFEPSRITRKESSDIKEIEENMSELALKRASSTHTVDEFLNSSNINHEFDILKYINKSIKSDNENVNQKTNKLFEEPDIIDPLLIQYKRKTPRMGSLMNKNEKELDRLRKFDSNLELNIGNSRKNVIGGMFSSSTSSSMNYDVRTSTLNENDNENIILKQRNNSINLNTKTKIKPIGLLKALSRINSTIF